MKRPPATCVTALAAAVVSAALLLSGCARSEQGVAAAPPTSVATAPTPATSAPATSVAPSPATASPAAVSTSPAKPNPCAANSSGQLVRVSLSQQHMWMCQGRTLAYDTAITSGASSLPYDATPTGNFHVEGRDRDTVLTLNTGRQYTVQYWIPFNAPLYGFHDASWQTFPYGSAQYKTDGSHGCVHMPLTAIAFFYHWVHVGADVQIRA